MAISDEDLEDLLTSVARIIDRYGDVYWPIFERLEGELQQRQSRRDRVAARLDKAKSSSVFPKRAQLDTAELS